MILVLKQNVSKAEISLILNQLEESGFKAHVLPSMDRPLISLIPPTKSPLRDMLLQLENYDFIENIIVDVKKPYRIVSRSRERAVSVIHLDGLQIGGSHSIVMAGPCAVESEAQIMAVAKAVSKAGATVLRGGAYKPSTSPYSFHGLGAPALEMLKIAGKKYNLKVITEVMDPRKVDLVSQYSDILQIGTRNMQNFDLLREVGLSKQPVLLKRGMGASYEEWLLAAEYIAANGNENIILCERGIRTFEAYTRNTLDLSAVPIIKELSHLPIIVDPSQGTGRRELVAPMSLAALAAGADGLLIEVHPDPDRALKDGMQSLSIEQFSALVFQLEKIAEVMNKPLCKKIKKASARRKNLEHEMYLKN